MSITIHDISKELNENLSKRASLLGKSKNRLIKDLLAEAVGLPTEDGFSDDYGEFFGLWSSEDVDLFEAAQKENTSIDEEEWK